MTGRRLKKFAKVVTILLIVGLGLSIVAAYAGIEPLALYKDTVRDKITNLTTQYLPSSEPEYPHTKQFKGTYVTTLPLLGSEQILIFKGGTITIVDGIMGRSIYRYVVTMQSESEGILELVDIATEQVSLISLQYIKEADCIILYPLGKAKGGMTYCK